MMEFSQLLAFGAGTGIIGALLGRFVPFDDPAGPTARTLAGAGIGAALAVAADVALHDTVVGVYESGFFGPAVLAVLTLLLLLAAYAISSNLRAPDASKWALVPAAAAAVFAVLWSAKILIHRALSDLFAPGGAGVGLLLIGALVLYLLTHEQARE